MTTARGIDFPHRRVAEGRLIPCLALDSIFKRRSATRGIIWRAGPWAENRTATITLSLRDIGFCEIVEKIKKSGVNGPGTRFGLSHP